jgi:hypothetical protein
MYLWDAGLERSRKEEEGAWVRAYTTTRDALVSVEEMKHSGKPSVPDYVKPHLPARTEIRPMNIDDQLRGLAQLFPDNVDLGESRAG